MREELQKKVDKAVKLIKMGSGDDVVEVCYSGGKDSEVILELAKMSGIKYRAIYKNTTIDPPGTIAHCKLKGVEVMKPRMTFLKLIEKKGMPTRRARFCCEYLKEYKILDKAIQGVRRNESTARAERYDESDPIICREYGCKANHVDVILPILGWTNEDVAEFISERGIKCHPLYYDDDGNFHVERRLGCIGCPLKSDNGCADYKAYPKLLRQVAKSVKVWFDNHPDSTTVSKFGTHYGLLANDFFYDSYEKWKLADDGLFGKTDWKSKLEDYFGIKL